MKLSLEPSAIFLELNDRDVVKEVVNGNREMFEVIVRRHNQRLFRVGIAYLRQREQVEDAMQNTYLKAFLHLRHFEGTSAFATWLTRIMINECLGVLRKRKTQVEESSFTDMRDEPDQPEETDLAAQKISLNEMKTLLENAIAGLPTKYRIVYMLREVEQLDTNDVASTLGLSLAAVRVRLHRARESLKNSLLASTAGRELFTYGASHCQRLTTRIMALILKTA